MSEKLIDIRSLQLDELIAYFEQAGEKAYRAKQVYEWLWKKQAISFDEMTNLSISLREMLQKNFIIRAVVVSDHQISSDRTIKNAFKLYDGSIVEGVLIPTSTGRMTACISSQVGCSLTCKFCGTGRLKLMRNINADEIFANQLKLLVEELKTQDPKIRQVILSGIELTGDLQAQNITQKTSGSSGSVDQAMLTNIKANNINIGDLTQEG